MITAELPRAVSAFAGSQPFVGNLFY
jgi:hypothetical protein